MDSICLLKICTLEIKVTGLSILFKINLSIHFLKRKKNTFPLFYLSRYFCCDSCHLCFLHWLSDKSTGKEKAHLKQSLNDFGYNLKFDLGLPILFQITIGDIQILVALELILQPENEHYRNILDDYPLVKGVFERIQNSPRIKEYLNKRGPRIYNFGF